MRIYSFSRILGIPIGLAVGYILYSMFFTYDDISIWFILAAIIPGVAILVFNGQIDHWYLERYPLQLDDKVRKWLLRYDTYYQSLDESSKMEMDKRTALYERGRSFEAVGQTDMNDVPFDIRCIISAQAVKMTMHHNDYLLGDMDRIYIYRHPFPTPRHQFLHTVETEIEDGVMIFALDHLLPGLQEPDKYYNICGHGIADAYIKVYPAEDWPDTTLLKWEEVQQFSGFSRKQILGVLGYETIDLLPVYLMYYFTLPDKVEAASPEVFEKLQSLFTAAPAVMS